MRHGLVPDTSEGVGGIREGVLECVVTEIPGWEKDAIRDREKNREDRKLECISGCLDRRMDRESGSEVFGSSGSWCEGRTVRAPDKIEQGEIVFSHESDEGIVPVRDGAW